MSLADCVNNVNIVASGTSAETATNDEDTTWTPASSIGSEGTYYWCAENNDGIDTSDWTGMGSFILEAENMPPNAPFLVSPPDGSTTTDDTPTLSAHFSDPDDGDTGTTNYRIASSSLADCVNNVNIVASGTSAETATNDEDTTWTPASSIGSEGTCYWCAENNDGIDTSDWTGMGSFILEAENMPPNAPFLVSPPDGSTTTDDTPTWWYITTNREGFLNHIDAMNEDGKARAILLRTNYQGIHFKSKGNWHNFKSKSIITNKLALIYC